MYKKLDLVISFDTTGSMYSVLSQVRHEVSEFVNTMFDKVEDLRVGIICHGDYCDKDHPYTIRVRDLTTDKDKLTKFIRETESTFGGDADECYELVLKVANEDISWGEKREKVLIMIGDSNPHGIHYSMNTDHIDWEEEAVKLANKNIKIFGVHALANYRRGSKRFYESISKCSGGVYLTLDNFNEVADLVMMTAMNQEGEERLNEYVTIIRDKGRMTRSLASNIDRLTGKISQYTDELRKINRPGLVPVPAGRFQTMKVDSDVSIRAFITCNGIDFKPGRGFYELTKHETVQQYKEIILQDRETGEMFNGDQVREYLGLQPQVEKGGVKESLSSRDIREFRVFVQSTSYNRKLIGGTTLLYEVSDFVESSDVTPVESKILTDKAVKTEDSGKPKAKKKDKKPIKKDEAPVEDKKTEVGETAKEKPVEAKKPETEVKRKTKKSSKKVPAVTDDKVTEDVKKASKPTVKTTKSYFNNVNTSIESLVKSLNTTESESTYTKDLSEAIKNLEKLTKYLKKF